MAITEYEDQIQEIVSKPDHSEFIYDFLGVYDIPRATVTKLRKGMNNLAKEAGAVYLKNKLYFREGTGDLMQDYADLQERVDELGSKPRYLLVTDYQHLLAKDTKTNETLDIEFAKLPQYFDFFLAWNGIEKADFEKENPADVRAAERFAKLYDVVVKDNPDATRKGLNLFLIRILFCLFAEDTNIFEHDLFTNRVKQMTDDDGSDFDQFIGSLFGVLDFEKGQRPVDTPSWLNDFPYVDGDLFKDRHESLYFSAKSRKLIIEAGELLKWDQINPDILGSMIQAVASEDSRSHLGMHYTSVPNIMKVIKPLFLDGLREDFEAAKGNEDKLQQLYDRIGKIKFMDPACGSGNFLIITYKELRQLEIDILIELNNIGVSTMYVPSVTLDQFYGIEIEDFACDVTRLSLWIAEHQMNVKLHEQISDAVRPTLPLRHAGAVVNANALRVDWDRIVYFHMDDEVYLFGNPPYIGSRNQTLENKQDMLAVFTKKVDFKKLDYVTAWYMKAARFISGTKAKISFVTTNSIFQGEQVDILWPEIFKLNVDIFSAHTSFLWKNNAKNNAGVTVAIAALKNVNEQIRKSLYMGDKVETNVDNISPYLSVGGNQTVHKQSKRIDGLPIIQKGNAAYDDGYLTLSDTEAKSIIEEDPKAKSFVKKYVSASDFIAGVHKYCIWVSDDDCHNALQIPEIAKRVALVKKYRESSNRSVTQKAANTPYKFGEVRWHPSPAIILPVVSSASRYYIPMGYVDSDVIPSYATFVLYGAEVWLFGLLESRMHMVWLRQVGGRLKNDFRYSAGLVYNTFPIPNISVRRKSEIEDLVFEILDIREEEEGTLAELYGSPLAEKHPIPMNQRLLSAHERLDKVVDAAYRADGFDGDDSRLALLLKLYNEERGVKNEK